jgi:hypothetical protein
MKEVKLNTSGIKYTPSVFITYYEVSTNFTVKSEAELLTLDEVKKVLNSHQPIVKGNSNHWSIGITTPIRELPRQAKRF